MLLSLLLFLCLQGQSYIVPDEKPNIPVVHPNVGKTLVTDDLQVMFVARKSNYACAPEESLDADIDSPKSVNVHPTEQKYYVNNLEGCNTVVYDLQTGENLKVITHQLGDTHAHLWAPQSGFYKFKYTYSKPNNFSGKPVESTLSHDGRYLWVPYYRRTYDLNAQEPSAMAVIDTKADTIVKLFETGPLPKMVAVSNDQTRLAVTHWGNNTVGILDIASSNPDEWKYIANLVVDYELRLNFSRTEKVDRDSNSGYCLRGTVFTPDGKYLLVGCMGGGGGIAVIELENNRYLGRILGPMPSLRHIVIKNGYLYASINSSGYVQRIPLETLYAKIQSLNGSTSKQVTVTDWVSCKVPAGARTIQLTPDGKYIFVACNVGSALAVVDAQTMKLLGTISADSFPVGLDISQDGSYVFTTSQGRRGFGGNSVNIFEIKYL